MKTDLLKRKLVGDLEKAGKKVNLWKRIALELERPTRAYTQVNISKIQKHTKDGETALIPGKVLSLGKMEKKLTVAAFKFSESALEKINANGKAIYIDELLKTNPQGKKVRILK